jgi:hypothetical protein
MTGGKHFLLVRELFIGLLRARAGYLRALSRLDE